MSRVDNETPDRDYSALVSGCALVDEPRREWLTVSGEDRLRFVNGLVTCDVRNLQVGDGIYGLFLSSQGRILADVVITATDQSLQLDLPPEQALPIVDHMLRYKVADRVEVAPVEQCSQVVVAGPESAKLLEQVLHQPMPEGDWGSRQAGDLWLHQESRLGVEAVRVRGSEEELAALEKKLGDAGAVSVGSEAISIVRIERGVPWYGVDFGDENFPQETGLESQTVSYTKGCYLGQEIVARIHYRGHVNRRLCGLSGAKSAIRPGSPLFFEQECVGKVTSAAVSRLLGDPVALAMVHRKAQEVVTLENGTRLAIVDLPFV
jgi:aminomethyltransferase